MKRSLVFVFCFLSVIPLARAQETHPQGNSASLDGIVVKEPGSEPLKKVLLQLIAEDQKDGGNYTASTDTEGHFQIENVQPGRYRLFVEKTGLLQINDRGHKVEGSILDFRAGDALKGVLFHMLPMAVITGHVVDEDGDPLPNFGVTVGRRKPVKSTDVEALGGERTNDLGEYRISGLFPGQYYVSVTPAPDFANLGRAPQGSEAEGKAQTGYLTTYYPGTTDASQASLVTLKAGDEMPVNFTIVPTRTYRIRGVVAGIAARQKPMVQLITKGLNSLTMNAADVAEDGQFELRGVAPGSYLLNVYSGSEGETLSARQSVTVTAGDVEGVKLTPVRPFTLSGRVRFEGTPPTDATQYSVFLQNPEDPDEVSSILAFAGGTVVARVDRAGYFQLAGVAPGRYAIGISGSGSSDVFVKSVNVGGADGSAGFQVNGPGAIDMVVSSKGGVLEGIVHDKDRPAMNSTVIAVPEEKYRRIRQRFGIGATDQNGDFSIRGLAPGTYTVFAWQDLEDGLYYDTDFLKAQEDNGTPVKVGEGSRQTIELKTSAVSEEWQ